MFGPPHFRLRSSTTVVGFVAALAALPFVFASCGGGNGNAGGGGGQSTSDGAGGAGTGGTPTTTTPSGTGGDPCNGAPGNVINGCKADGSDATDMRGMGPQTIVFGDLTGFAYDPKCLMIDDTQTVEFDGDFVSHPLTSGEVRDGALCEDGGPVHYGGASPKVFTLPAGVYPYYCGIHGPAGMDGLLVVKAGGGTGGGGTGGAGGAGGGT